MEVGLKMQLARSIAASIDAVLPPGFHCYADEDSITIDEAEGLWTTTPFGELVGRGGDEHEEIAHAAWAVLNSVQDFVIEGKDFRGDNWPGPREGKLPLPGTAVINGKLEMWFGERAAPMLRLSSVDVARSR
jgi:hypothetical protein